MKVKELINILQNCSPEDEITFIFDENERLSQDRGHNLKEVTMINVCGHKINGKIALSNGVSAKLLKGDEETIFNK